MDGDGIGGSINLSPKPPVNVPRFSFSGMGGYMPILGGRNQVETTGTVGQRFGHDKKVRHSCRAAPMTGPAGELTTSNQSLTLLPAVAGAPQL